MRLGREWSIVRAESDIVPEATVSVTVPPDSQLRKSGTPTLCG